VLLHFAYKDFLCAGLDRCTIDCESVQYGWDLATGKFHVDDGTDNLNDATLIHGVLV
jgi:hypothetical protein